MDASNDPLIVAQNLRTVISNARSDTEERRCLTLEVVEALIDGGLLRLAAPASLGGYEAEPRVALSVYEELAGVEASVAWLVWNNSLPALQSRHILLDSARKELFEHQVLAISTRPSGRAAALDGGYRVTGQWSLVSGCELADLIPLNCVITDGTEPRTLPLGGPDTRMMCVLKGSYSIVDNWNVGGLRGTGSHDVVVKDVFVAAERTYSMMDPIQIDRPLYQMPLFATMSAGCAAICLGIAQASIDALMELGITKVQVLPAPGLRDRPATQMAIAASAADLDAARLLVNHALGDAWASCCDGTPVTDVQRARLWSSAVHAAKTAKSVVTTMYEAAGSSSLYDDCPIERAHRDVHAAAQSSTVEPQFLQEAGRVLFGLEPNNPHRF